MENKSVDVDVSHRLSSVNCAFLVAISNVWRGIIRRRAGLGASRAICVIFLIDCRVSNVRWLGSSRLLSNYRNKYKLGEKKFRSVCNTKLKVQKSVNSPLPFAWAIGRTGFPLESHSRPPNHRRFLLVICVPTRCCSTYYPAWQKLNSTTGSLCWRSSIRFAAFTPLARNKILSQLSFYDNFTNKNIHKTICRLLFSFVNR